MGSGSFEIGPTANYCLDGVLALIHTFIKMLQNKYPGIKNARYDFNTRQFVGANNLPIRRGDGAGSFDAAGSSPAGRVVRAGEATLRRGILIQSLVAAEGSERPGLLEQVLRGACHLVTRCARSKRTLSSKQGKRMPRNHGLLSSLVQM